MENQVMVLIPAHNEEKNIGSLVRDLKKRFFLVVVVDDGSTDRTAVCAARAGGLVLRHRVCRGKGRALRTGFAYARQNNFPAVITMDGDGQHRVEDTEAFLAAYRRKPEVGIWVGRRTIVSSGMPLLRRLTNLTMSWLISFFSVQYIPDTQSGFRLITRPVLERIRLATSHFETESEILIKTSWSGYRISSVPISTIYGTEKSKIRAGRDTLRFFRMLVGLLGTGLRPREKDGF